MPKEKITEKKKLVDKTTDNSLPLMPKPNNHRLLKKTER